MHSLIDFLERLWNRVRGWFSREVQEVGQGIAENENRDNE